MVTRAHLGGERPDTGFASCQLYCQVASYQFSGLVELVEPCIHWRCRPGQAIMQASTTVILLYSTCLCSTPRGERSVSCESSKVFIAYVDGRAHCVRTFETKLDCSSGSRNSRQTSRVGGDEPCNTVDGVLKRRHLSDVPCNTVADVLKRQQLSPHEPQQERMSQGM